MRRLSPLLYLVLLAARDPAPRNDGLTWHWDRDNLGCSLDQQTSSSWTPVSISHMPGTDETSVSFKVRSPSFWKGYYPDGHISLSDGTTLPAEIHVYSGPNRSYFLEATLTDPRFQQALAGTSSITIEHTKFGKFEVPVMDAGPAVSALRACEDSRLKEWGVDTASLRALQSRPIPTTPLKELFTSFDYPGVGLSGFLGANIIAKLEVGDDGGVRACTWLGPPDFPQFGKAICKGLVEKARFRPARDASGRPVSAPYVTWASFRMSL